MIPCSFNEWLKQRLEEAITPHLARRETDDEGREFNTAGSGWVLFGIHRLADLVKQHGRIPVITSELFQKLLAPRLARISDFDYVKSTIEVVSPNDLRTMGYRKMANSTNQKEVGGSGFKFKIPTNRLEDVTDIMGGFVGNAKIYMAIDDSAANQKRLMQKIRLAMQERNTLPQQSPENTPIGDDEVAAARKSLFGPETTDTQPVPAKNTIPMNRAPSNGPGPLASRLTAARTRSTDPLAREPAPRPTPQEDSLKQLFQRRSPEDPNVVAMRQRFRDIAHFDPSILSNGRYWKTFAESRVYDYLPLNG